MSDAREHALCVLRRRVAQLEEDTASGGGGGDHWLMNLHSVFAAVARVLVTGRLEVGVGDGGEDDVGEGGDGGGDGEDRGDTVPGDVDSGLGPGGQDRGSGGGGERDVRCRGQRRVRWSDEVVVWGEGKGEDGGEDGGCGSRLGGAIEAGNTSSGSELLLSFREHAALAGGQTRRSRRMSGGWRSREEEAIANNMPLAQVDDDFSDGSDRGRGLESVMRELIIGARDETLRTPTLIEEPGYARWFRQPNGFNSG